MISHRNITRVIDIYAEVEEGYDLGSVVSRIEDKLQKSSTLKPLSRESERGEFFVVNGSEYEGKGYNFTITGEMHLMRDSFKQFRKGLFIAIMLIYLIMVAHFRSFVYPLIVMFTLPMGFVGIGILLFFTGTTLNIQSFMGIIMMTGIVVEYSIVLVDFAISISASAIRKFASDSSMFCCVTAFSFFDFISTNRLWVS